MRKMKGDVERRKIIRKRVDQIRKDELRKAAVAGTELHLQLSVPPMFSSPWLRPSPPAAVPLCTSTGSCRPIGRSNTVLNSLKNSSREREVR